MIKELIARTVYGFSRMRPYERLCIDAVRELLPDTAQAILDNNIKYRGWVQRGASDKQVLFRWIDPKDEARLVRFPNRSESAYFARIQLAAKDGKPIQVDLSLYDGMIFALEFNRPPSYLGVPISIIQTRITSDVMLSCSTSGVEAAQEHFIRLKELLHGIQLEEVQPAASEHERSEFRERIGPTAPADLFDLLELTNEFRVGDWKFLGTNAQRLLLAESNVWSLAETQMPPQSLCVFEDGEMSGVFIYSHEDGDFEPTGKTFVGSLLGVIQQTERKGGSSS